MIASATPMSPMSCRKAAACTSLTLSGDKLSSRAIAVLRSATAAEWPFWKLIRVSKALIRALKMSKATFWSMRDNTVLFNDEVTLMSENRLLLGIR